MTAAILLPAPAFAALHALLAYFHTVLREHGTCPYILLLCKGPLPVIGLSLFALEAALLVSRNRRAGTGYALAA